MITLLSEPTTANGIMFCARTQVNAHSNIDLVDKTETYPNALVELHLLFIIFVVGIKRIKADTVMEELCPDL
jgi:hypothetical protein